MSEGTSEGALAVLRSAAPSCGSVGGEAVTAVLQRTAMSWMPLPGGPAWRDLAQALEDLSGQPHASEYLWWLVERVGTLACRQGAPERAAQLYGAAIAHRDTVPWPLDPAEQDLRARDLAVLRATLGANGFAAAYAAGQTLSLAETLALAHSVLA